MLNIDFKVSGNLVSVPLCLTDSIDSLLTRIQNIKPFKKYSRQQLQTKLKLSLQKIIQSGNLQDQVVDKIYSILCTNSMSNFKKTDLKQKSNILTETPLSILQETTLNIFNYNFLQQKKLKERKYNNPNYQLGNQNDLQNRLRVKYETLSKKQPIPNQHHQTYNRNHRQIKSNQNQVINQKLRAITNDYQMKKINNLGHKYIQNQENAYKQVMLKSNQKGSVASGYNDKSKYRINNYSQIKKEQSKYRYYDQESKTYNVYHKSTQKLEPLSYGLSNYNNHKSVGKIIGLKKYSYL